MAATGGTVEVEEESSVFKKPRLSELKEVNDKSVVDPPKGCSVSISTSTRKAKKNAIVTKMFNVQRKNEAEDAIAEFFFANGISFNATRSPQYKEMMVKICAASPSFQPPGYNKIRTTLLDRGVSKMQGLMEGLRK